jgi:hypothetical protein
VVRSERSERRAHSRPRTAGGDYAPSLGEERTTTPSSGAPKKKEPPPGSPFYRRRFFFFGGLGGGFAAFFSSTVGTCGTGMIRLIAKPWPMVQILVVIQ